MKLVEKKFSVHNPFNWVRSFTRQSIRTAGKTAHVYKVANFMINLKNTKPLSFYTCFEVGNRASS